MRPLISHSPRILDIHDFPIPLTKHVTLDQTSSSSIADVIYEQPQIFVNDWYAIHGVFTMVLIEKFCILRLISTDLTFLGDKNHYCSAGRVTGRELFENNEEKPGFSLHFDGFV